MVKTNFIPAKEALILWKPKKHQEDFVLKVVYYPNYLANETRYKEYPMSSGAAFFDWREGWTEAQMFGECMRILFSEKVTNRAKVKQALYEFGKIRELHQMRSLYHALFYEFEMPRESLEVSVFAWDFCEGLQ